MRQKRSLVSTTVTRMEMVATSLFDGVQRRNPQKRTSVNPALGILQITKDFVWNTESLCHTFEVT